MAKAFIELAQNLYRIPTMGSGINSFLIAEEDGSLTLIDAGLDTAPKKIVAAITQLGKNPSDVRNVIFTHSHPDHIGGAAHIINIIGEPQVFAHKDEVPYLEAGKVPPRDFTHLAGLFFRFAPEQGFDPIKVNTAIQDRELLPFGGGLEVIHTPGHTPGHVSFLHKPSATLITGDSIFNFGFKIAWSISAFCTNFQQSKETARKFLDLDFEAAAFTHGPHISVSAKDKLKSFLANKTKD